MNTTANEFWVLWCSRPCAENPHPTHEAARAWIEEMFASAKRARCPIYGDYRIEKRLVAAPESLAYQGTAKVRVLAQGVSGKPDDQPTEQMRLARERQNSGLKRKAIQAQLQKGYKADRPHRDRKKFK